MNDIKQADEDWYLGYKKSGRKTRFIGFYSTVQLTWLAIANNLIDFEGSDLSVIWYN